MVFYTSQEWRSGSRLTFLVVVPLGIALWYALVKIGAFAQHFPFPLALVYWLCLLLPRWWLQDLATNLLHRLLARWRPNRVVLLTLGGALGIVLFQPYGLWVIGWFQQTFADYMPASAQYPIGTRSSLFFQGLIGTVPQHLAALALWVFASLIYDAVTGSSRLTYQAAAVATDAAATESPLPVIVPDATPAIAPEASPVVAGAAARSSDEAPAPGFATRLRKVRWEEIIAVEAEDHYVRVHGQTQSELIHYRFTDALADLSGVPGMRVHRSFWVARAAVRTMRRAGPNQALVLVNGAQIPIGRSYSEAVRQVGMVGHS